jgi:hypothetical protein
MTEEEERLKKRIVQRIPEWERAYGIPFSDNRVNLIIRHALDRQLDVEVAVEEIQAVQQAVRDFAEQFSLKNRLVLSFSDDAVDALVEIVWKEPLNPGDYLRTLLHNYSQGLNLIRQKTGKQQFLIIAEGVQSPEIYLNRLIQEAYRQEN